MASEFSSPFDWSRVYESDDDEVSQSEDYELNDHNYNCEWPFRRVQQFGGSVNEGVKFEVVSSSDIINKKSKNLRYEMTGTEFEIKHNINDFLQRDGDNYNFRQLLQVAPIIDSMFNSIVSPFLDKAGENDFIGIHLSHESFTSDVYISFVGRQNFRCEELLNNIYRLVQSGRDIFLSGNLKLSVSVIKFISGEGSKAYNKRVPVSVTKFFNDKKSVVNIKTTKNNCGFLALTLGKMIADDPSFRGTNRWFYLITKNCKALQDECSKIFRDYGGYDQEVHLSEVANIEKYMKNYQLIIVMRPCSGIIATKIYRGKFREKKIFLEFIELDSGGGHYNLITNINKYYGLKSFCIECWQGSKDKYSHECGMTCKMCFLSPPCEYHEPTQCQECSITFANMECYNRHKTNKICEIKKTCKECSFEGSKKAMESHECDAYKCRHCGVQYETSPHYCSIGSKSYEKLAKEDSINKIIVAYDIETRTEKRLSDNSFQHEANLLMSHTVCDLCYDFNERLKKGDCRVCGNLENIFFEMNDDDDVVDRFIDYLMDELSPKAEKAKAVVHIYAHNSKSFDGRFIFRNLWKRRLRRITPVMCGSKILKLSVGNLTFLDSLSFFQCPLRNLPKCFDMAAETVKGDFPHKFNKRANYNYVGSIPPLDEFGVDHMNGEDKAKLIQWWNDQTSKRYVFNFKHELISYCRKDVEILLNAVQRFRMLFKEITGLDPTTRNFTLAAIGQEVFRAKLLNSDIGIVPINGYLSKRKSSFECESVLDWFGKKQSILREQRKGPYFVDGYCKETNTVIEYQGCYWHGCAHVHGDENKIITRKDGSKTTPNELYNDTKKKLDYLKKRGFNVISIWGHEWDEMCENDPTLRAFYEHRKKHHRNVFKYSKTLIRESLFGGRTQNFCMYYNCADTEELKYVDFISLYPYVLKNEIFPSGHPIVYTENFPDLNDVFGFVTCKIICPQQLRYPVLPSRDKNRLIFGLCGECIRIGNSAYCKHKPEERVLQGTWTSVEILAALQQGYKILELQVIHNYPESQRKGNMFTAYIDMWLKIKQEASGWPSECITDELKAKYIEEYSEREGINLEPSKITKNPGKRQIAKLMLNSFWGKLAQRNNQPETLVVTEYSQLLNILMNKKIRIKGHDLVSEDVVLVSYEFVDEADARKTNTSPAVASFVTAYARLKLYKLILKLTEKRIDRIKYCDTDSAIFSHIEGVDEKLDLGSFLGNLTDEIEGYKCSSGVFTGPKSYALKMHSRINGAEKKIIKIKGLSLTDGDSGQLGYDQMLELAEERVSNPHQEVRKIGVPQTQFRSNKTNQIIRTENFEKIFRVSSGKMIHDGNAMFPIGYVK